MRPVEHILDLARWAPSGDNTQPWRFQMLGDDHFIVRGFDTREWCLYDVDGRPSQLALGALLENIGIAARSHGFSVVVKRRADTPDTMPEFSVRLVETSGISPDPLVSFIEARSVQRRPLRSDPLGESEKLALEACVGADYSIRWLEGLKMRWQVARLLFANAKLRLTAPEAYPVHRAVIAWNCRFSETKIPDAAIGLDPLTTQLMQWVMRSWQRVEFFNRYLAGTIAPRIQLDLLPGLGCAAHFLIVGHSAPQSIDDFVSAGRAMQRFWLTATQLGVRMQPEMTPLIFATYVRQGRSFSKVKAIWKQAQLLAARLQGLVGADMERVVFMGRVGHGPPPAARSVRLPLSALVVQ